MKRLFKNVLLSLFVLSLVSCVEDTHDLSKDFDSTVAVGNGICFPLGDTEKILMTEMLKGNKLLKTDEKGNFYIEQNGDIAAYNTEVDVDLGNDMDFFYDADTKFLFNNPQLFITLDNNENKEVLLKVSLSSYDRDGNVIAKDVQFDLTIPAKTKGKYYVTKNAAPLNGYTAVKGALPELFSDVPSRISILLEPYGTSTGYNAVGDYNLVAPLDFGYIEYEYVDRSEDVLGSDPEDAVKHISSFNLVTVSFDAYNTCPTEFTPSLVVYDVAGNRMESITAVTTSVIESGNGHLAAPVLSKVEFKLSSVNNELKYMNDIEFFFKGVGEGVYNKNDYLQLKNVVVRIDSPIILDFN